MKPDLYHIQADIAGLADDAQRIAGRIDTLIEYEERKPFPWCLRQSLDGLELYLPWPAGDYSIRQIDSTTRWTVARFVGNSWERLSSDRGVDGLAQALAETERHAERAASDHAKEAHRG